MQLNIRCSRFSASTPQNLQALLYFKHIFVTCSSLWLNSGKSEKTYFAYFAWKLISGTNFHLASPEINHSIFSENEDKSNQHYLVKISNNVCILCYGILLWFCCFLDNNFLCTYFHCFLQCHINEFLGAYILIGHWVSTEKKKTFSKRISTKWHGYIWSRLMRSPKWILKRVFHLELHVYSYKIHTMFKLK